MAKLSPVYEYKKDGSKIVKGYKLALPKIATELAGFDNRSDVLIKFDKNKIILEKSED